jgi:paraquat-inducible protein A
MNDTNSDSRVICHECDLLACVLSLPPGHKASCPRCGAVFTRAHKNALDRILVFGLTAVVCLLFSNLFSYVNLSVQGQHREITLLQTVQVLFELNEWTLAAFVAVVIIGLPTFFVGVISWLAVSIKLKRVSANTINLLKIVGYLRFWNMAEIFFLGILVSMVKVSSMAEIDVGISFWAYAMFNVFLIAAMANVDRFQLSRSIKQIVWEKQGVPVVR